MRTRHIQFLKPGTLQAVTVASVLCLGLHATSIGAGFPVPEGERKSAPLVSEIPASVRRDSLAQPHASFVAIHTPAVLTPLRYDLLSPEHQFPPGPMLAASRSEEFADDDKDRVSVSRAALLSLALPGAGQWYAGARGRAAAFLAAEGVLWAAYGFFETVGEAKKTDYRVYARVHAGIDPAGKDDAFYRTITFYDSREEYNNVARVFDPRRPYFSDIPYWQWQWDSDASRSKYRTIRNQSNEAFNRRKFTLGGLALNRLVAALDAIRVAKSVNRRARMETASWKIHLRGNPVAHSPDFAVTFSRGF